MEVHIIVQSKKKKKKAHKKMSTTDIFQNLETRGSLVNNLC